MCAGRLTALQVRNHSLFLRRMHNWDLVNRRIWIFYVLGNANSIVILNSSSMCDFHLNPVLHSSFWNSKFCFATSKVCWKAFEFTVPVDVGKIFTNAPKRNCIGKYSGMRAREYFSMPLNYVCTNFDTSLEEIILFVFFQFSIFKIKDTYAMFYISY